MDPTLIAAASVNISGGGGGQYITNVHLEPYADLHDFHDNLYPSYQSALFSSAATFLRKTEAKAGQTLVLVSAGFDACQHEYPGMSRHGAKVPMSFYTRFAQDVGSFADERGEGKLVAVLEGGYSLRALSTGVGHFRMYSHSPVKEMLTERFSNWTSGRYPLSRACFVVGDAQSRCYGEAPAIQPYRSLPNEASTCPEEVIPAITTGGVAPLCFSTIWSHGSGDTRSRSACKADSRSKDSRQPPHPGDRAERGSADEV